MIGLDQLRRALEPVYRRIHFLVARAVITRVVDSGALQRVQVKVLDGEVLDNLERVGAYGFYSNPLPGAEAVLVFLNGDRTQGVVISTEDRRYRLKGLVKGEVAAGTDEGDYLWFKRGRKLQARANKFLFQGESVELMVQLSTLAADVKALADAVAALALATNSGVALTQAVTGVLVGSGLFSVPDNATLTAAGTSAATAASDATTAGTAATAAGVDADTRKTNIEGITA